MNILFVNHIPFNPSFGGVERVTDVLSKALIEHNYRVYYLWAYVEEKNTSMLEYDFPAEYYVLPNKGFFDSAANIEYYNSLLDELSIDIVVNQQGIYASQNNILSCKKKTISVIHSNPDSYIQLSVLKILSPPKTNLGFIKYLIKILLYPLLRKRITKIVSREVSKQYSYISAKSDAVVLLSDRYKDKFVSYMLDVYPKILKGIPNPNTYSYQDFDINSKEKIILYVGRISNEDKCPLRLLKIWRYLYKQYIDWQLIIVGDGPDFYNMRDYITKYKLQNVKLLGTVTEPETLYRKAAMICLTSTFEGWGMALTEGMQFGCIPLTFDNYEAASDIIDDDVNGCLIPAYNLKTYARRLSELMDNAEKRKTMAMEAHKKSINFDVNNIVQQWEDLFHSVMY